jgi:hypothetical protein
VPAIYAHFSSNVTIYLSNGGCKVVIEATGVPDHKSSYFDSSDPLYTGTCSGMHKNAFSIDTQSTTFQLPCKPSVAAATTSTNAGTIGVALNGVSIFDSYAANAQPLDDEVTGFDVYKNNGCHSGYYNGHPTPGNVYHYHVNPAEYTYNNHAALIGMALDGFPIYGSEDMDNTEPSDLDDCRGHFGVTADYPEGSYHYHAKAQFDLVPPYTVGCYAGTKGSVTN